MEPSRRLCLDTRIMGKDGKLYTYKPEAGQDWQDVKEPAGVKGITRVAVSPIGDVLALVGTRSES